MRQIYKKAKQVIVWLGFEDDTTALAVTTMQNVFESYCSVWYGPASKDVWLRKLVSDDNSWQSFRKHMVKKVSPQWPGDPKICANALQIFFRRPWFYRVWVIQEVRGCPNVIVQVGRTAVAWKIVASTAVWVVYAPSTVTHIIEPYKFGGFLHTDLMCQRRFTTKADVPFLEVLDRCRAFKSTIDQDRIFALLQHPTVRLLPVKNRQQRENKVLHSLCRDTDQDTTHFGIKVDYNMTLFDVYRQVVLSSISEGCSLQVLSHVTEEPKCRENYPSWMPVWHARGNFRYIGPRRTFLYNASREQKPLLRTFTNPMLLGLGGLIAGTVTQVSTNILLSDREVLQGKVIRHGTTQMEMREVSRLVVRDCWQPEDNWLPESICRASLQPATHFEDFCAFITKRLQKTPGPTILSLHGKRCDICMQRHIASPASGLDEIIEILHCEICIDFHMCRDCHRSGRTCPGQHELYARPIPSIICQLDHETRSFLDEHKGEGNSKRFGTGVKQSFDGKIFIKLDNGFFGVAPDATRVGDLVVVFFGGRVPFILRRCGSHYVLLGECYVRGIMDGEVVDDWHNGKLEEVAFVLA